MDALLGRLAGQQVLHRGGRLLVPLLAEVGDEPRQGVGPAVQDEVLGQHPLRLADERVGAQVLGVDDGEVQAGLHGVEQEDRVDDLAGVLGEAEAHVGDAQGGEHAGVLGLDAPDALQGLHRALAVLLAAGGQREGEGVEDQAVGGHAVLAGHRHQAPGDLGLAVGGLGHPLLVDGHADHRRAVALHQRQDLQDPLAALLQVDGVDDAAPRGGLERRLDDVRLGRVDHERRVDRLGQQLDQGAHLRPLVVPLVQGHADVEDVGPGLDLAAGDGQQPRVVVGDEELLHLAGALAS